MAKTTVVFKKIDDEIIALFPFVKWDDEFITSYQHIGQHGGASRDLIKELPNATSEEYKELKKELISIGYNL